MIFIAVRFTVRPDRADQWLDLVADFTRATREEPGNLFFDWSRSVDDPNVYTLLEGFADDEAGAVHVASDHFAAGLAAMAGAVATTPEIINVRTEQRGWGPMAELAPTEG
ncbi:putative quinol monooxygenase [Streptomyces sp. NPDC035033]|uniref:putative quinol monooxygenase n=1 Tax=Streptomyces sp. NPDC035033 TaxID=3155368 RepID=UPI0033E9C174